MLGRESERKNDSEHRFKPREADWLKEGGREDDWIRIMMSVLTVWESGSHVKTSR